MATNYTYLPGLKTGSDLGYPVVMRAGGLNVEDFIVQFEVKDDTEIAIGDLVMLAGGLLDATGASELDAYGIVMDTNRNKAILESHGLTVSKTAQFSDGDKIDVLLLTSPFILSMKCEGGVDMQVGEPVGAVAGGKVEKKASITLTEAAPNTLVTTSDPLGLIGYVLTYVSTQDGTDGYVAVKVSK